MKTRIDSCLHKLKKNNKKAFTAYITAGDPNLSSTVDMVLGLEDRGVDIIELGLPFSDPLADGRVNQEASIRALNSGSTFNGVMECISKIRESSQIPIVLYAYMNPLLYHGFDDAIINGKSAGIDGFLILDLPVEESKPYRDILIKNNVNAIQLITPTTPDSRIDKIIKHANGFVYCVSREGVTGVQDKIAGGAQALVKRIKNKTNLPVLIGFGIGTPDQAREASKIADGVVVGSAIVNVFNDAKNNNDDYNNALDFVGSMVNAVKKV